MGLTHVTVTLKNLEPPNKEDEALFLVDAGATDSLAPSDQLKEMGITKLGKTVYELADGSVKDVAYGIVRIEFMGEITAGRIIFAAPGSEPILGVTALESVGILVDPVNKPLRRLPAIPLK